MHLFLKASHESQNGHLLIEPYFEFHITLFDLRFYFTSYQAGAVNLESFVWNGMVHTPVITLEELY